MSNGLLIPKLSQYPEIESTELRDEVQKPNYSLRVRFMLKRKCFSSICSILTGLDDRTDFYQTPSIFVTGANRIQIQYTVGNVGYGEVIQYKIPTNKWIDFSWSQESKVIRVKIDTDGHVYNHELHHENTVDKFDSKSDMIIGGSKFCIGFDGIMSMMQISLWTSKLPIIPNSVITFENFISSVTSKVSKKSRLEKVIAENGANKSVS